MAKILLVDDDPLLVRMYQKKLENDGYVVSTADDGDVALREVVSIKPDLILLDIMMPRVNGLQVLSRLKDNQSTSAIPVILLTNVGGSEEDINRGLELGAVAYLVKASNRPKSVVEKVKEILSGYVHEVPKVKTIIHGASSMNFGTKVKNSKPLSVLSENVKESMQE